jgi:hypothetical protein
MLLLQQQYLLQQLLLRLPDYSGLGACMCA